MAAAASHGAEAVLRPGTAALRVAMDGGCGHSAILFGAWNEIYNEVVKIYTGMIIHTNIQNIQI